MENKGWMYLVWRGPLFSLCSQAPFLCSPLVWCVEGRTVASIESNHNSGMQWLWPKEFKTCSRKESFTSVSLVWVKRRQEPKVEVRVLLPLERSVWAKGSSGQSSGPWGFWGGAATIMTSMDFCTWAPLANWWHLQTSSQSRIFKCIKWNMSDCKGGRLY